MWANSVTTEASWLLLAEPTRLRAGGVPVRTLGRVGGRSSGRPGKQARPRGLRVERKTEPGVVQARPPGLSSSGRDHPGPPPPMGWRHR